jgi:hypothetical protein
MLLPAATQTYCKHCLLQAWNFLSGSSGAFVVPYVPLLLSQHGMSATQIGLLAALRPFLAAPSQMAASAAADKHRVHVNLLLVAAVVSSALRASLPLADSAVLLFVLLLASEAIGAPVNVLADSTVLSNCKDVSDLVVAVTSSPWVLSHGWLAVLESCIIVKMCKMCKPQGCE